MTEPSTDRPRNKQMADRKSASWIPARYAVGRRRSRDGIHGPIVGRANVGFEEEDWRFILEVAEGADSTISDVIRWAVAADRRECEAMMFEVGDIPSWKKEAAITQRFAHVEITNDE